MTATMYGAVAHAIVDIEHRDGAWHATVELRGKIIHVIRADGSDHWRRGDLIVTGSLARHLDDAAWGAT